MTKSEIFLVALSGLLAGVLLGVIILNVINEFSSSAWFCKRFGWHENPHEIGFDGLWIVMEVGFNKKGITT